MKYSGLIIFLILIIGCVVRESGREADILITDATIMDGSGAPPFEGNIMIQDGILTEIGPFEPGSVHAELTIDAEGRVVSPGFIDMHSHGNPLDTPQFENFLAMGVTTISLGQDGGGPRTPNISEWMEAVNDKSTGPNILYLQGHGNLRRLAGAPPESGLDDEFISKMQELMENAMESGAFGMTTGLEYEPGIFADLSELIAVARPVAEHEGLIMSHIRNEDNDQVLNSVAELISQGRGAGVNVHISHIKIVFGNDPAQAGEVLSLMEQARRDGVHITADIYPYTASYTGIGIVFPEWARPPHNFDEVVQNRRPELEEYLRNRVKERNGPEATLFGTSPWTGKTLAEVADSLDKPFEDVLIDDIGPRGAGAAYFVMNENVMRRFLQDPYVSICSDGSPTMQHPRSHGSFARIIDTYVNRENLLTLEEAIYKMSGLPAATLGLDNPKNVEIPRGLLKRGFAADLLIFDPKNIKENATFEDPHRLAEGIDWMFVNGKPAIRRGKLKSHRYGTVIKKKN